MNNELVQQVLREDPVLAAHFKERDRELHTQDRQEKMRARFTQIDEPEYVKLSRPLRPCQLEALGLAFIGLDARNCAVYERVAQMFGNDKDDRIVALSLPLDSSQLSSLGLTFAGRLRDEYLYKVATETAASEPVGEAAVVERPTLRLSDFSVLDRRALVYQVAEMVIALEKKKQRAAPSPPPSRAVGEDEECAEEALSAFNPRLNSNGRVVFDTNLSLDRLPPHMRTAPHTFIRTVSVNGEPSKTYKVSVPAKGCAKLQMNKSVAETLLGDDSSSNSLFLEIVCDDDEPDDAGSTSEVRAKILPKKRGRAETKPAATTKPAAATTKPAQYSSARRTPGKDDRNDQIMMAILSTPWDKLKKTHLNTIHHWFKVMNIELEDDACVQDFTKQGLLARVKKFYDDKLANHTVQAEVENFRAEQESKKLKK